MQKVIVSIGDSKYIISKPESIATITQVVLFDNGTPHKVISDTKIDNEKKPARKTRKNKNKNLFKWTYADDQAVVDLTMAGKGPKLIAKVLNRTRSSVYQRLVMLRKEGKLPPAIKSILN